MENITPLAPFSGQTAITIRRAPFLEATASTIQKDHS